MAYNSYYPASYQPVYQMPQYQYQPNYQQYQQPVQQVQQPQSRMVEAFPVDDEKGVYDFPVGNGVTQMFISRDDSFFAVKAVALDGNTSVIFYDKRPPAAPDPVFDPGAYVTKDELENRLETILGSLQGKPGKRLAKEAADE